MDTTGIKEKLGLLLVPTFPAPRRRAVVAVESRLPGGFRRVTTMPGGQTLKGNCACFRREGWWVYKNYSNESSSDSADSKIVR